MAKKQIKSLDMSGNGKSKTDKYDVPGLEKFVPRVREIDKEMEKLFKERDHIKSMILNKVIPIRQNEEKAGRLYKTFVILSEDGIPAQVVFKNAFSKIPVENEARMREELGEHFDEFYDIDETTALRRGVNWDDLKKALGKKFEDFFTTTRIISTVKDFMEKRAQMRAQMNKRANDALDVYSKDTQATPDLRMK